MFCASHANDFLFLIVIFSPGKQRLFMSLCDRMETNLHATGDDGKNWEVCDTWKGTKTTNRNLNTGTVIIVFSWIRRDLGNSSLQRVLCFKTNMWGEFLISQFTWEKITCKRTLVTKTFLHLDSQLKWPRHIVSKRIASLPQGMFIHLRFIAFQQTLIVSPWHCLLGTYPITLPTKDAQALLDFMETIVTKKFWKLKMGFSNSSSLKSSFKKLGFCGGLVWTVGLTVEIKLC